MASLLHGSGREHALGYDALRERYRGLPRGALARLLARGGGRGLGSSLLAPGLSEVRAGFWIYANPPEVAGRQLACAKSTVKWCRW